MLQDTLSLSGDQMPWLALAQGFKGKKDTDMDMN